MKAIHLFPWDWHKPEEYRQTKAAAAILPPWLRLVAPT